MSTMLELEILSTNVDEEIGLLENRSGASFPSLLRFIPEPFKKCSEDRHAQAD